MGNSIDTIKILIVDDEKDIRDVSKQILSKIGFQVMTASCANDALDMLKRKKTSIVFLDIKMPGMDGIEVLEQIRKIDQTILVIIITGHAEVKKATKAVKQGAYDFIIKPFEPDQMRITVNRAWEKIRLTRKAEKLEQARKRTLLDSDHLKSEFVAKVSHELRSPLSTIHEQLSLVIKNMAGEASTDDRHILTRAKEKTKGLISLTGDLLDLSRIAEGIICHNPKPVNLEEILKNIIDFLEIRAKAKKQSLTLDFLKTPLPLMVADPIALESIFGNLITNAINYTQDGGKITVKADLDDTNIQVQVIDNGFGIEDRHLKKIFERFYRVKNEKTRYITGTGLGLPIVKELTKSLDGLIDVKSNPGQGSTFTVLLPV